MIQGLEAKPGNFGLLKLSKVSPFSHLMLDLNRTETKVLPVAQGSWYDGRLL